MKTSEKILRKISAIAYAFSGVTLIQTAIGILKTPKSE